MWSTSGSVSGRRDLHSKHLIEQVHLGNINQDATKRLKETMLEVVLTLYLCSSPEWDILHRGQGIHEDPLKL